MCYSQLLSLTQHESEMPSYWVQKLLADMTNQLYIYIYLQRTYLTMHQRLGYQVIAGRESIEACRQWILVVSAVAAVKIF